jgi:hypothetical protein
MSASARRITQMDRGLQTRLARSPIGRRADPWPSAFHQTQLKEVSGRAKSNPARGVGRGRDEECIDQSSAEESAATTASEASETEEGDGARSREAEGAGAELHDLCAEGH